MLAAAVAGCAGSPAPEPEAQPARQAPAAAADLTAMGSPAAPAEPVLPPRYAMLAGLMPLRSLGADSFRVVRPGADGRGVLIAILDSGVDAALPGLRSTTNGRRKILDLRDFSAEGRVTLSRVEPSFDGVVDVEGHLLSGFGRVARIAAGPYYGGVFREIRLGAEPAADLNGNGRITDELPLVVGRASNGWVVVTDTDGDGALDDESPIHDYLVAAETFSYADPEGDPGPMTIAVNFSQDGGHPVLDLFMDNSGHGTHVAGIAAGHNMFGVEGFDGVAPGAYLLGLKIANNTRGGMSVSGAMVRAMRYAAEFARRRGLPLVLNLSFGVGNEREGAAVIDSLVNDFALRNPDVLLVISAGNDGPGLSSLGFPGSAPFALAVCALFPGVFAEPPQPGVPPAADVLGWWSARGGEIDKPDVCAPGVAFSNVPRWQTGEEISGGTSMAAPQVSGAAALLLSGMPRSGAAVRAIDLKRALTATARPMDGPTVLDQGYGVPNVTAAFLWLQAAHQAGVYHVQALPDGGNTSVGAAAYRREGLGSRGDTLQRFVVTSVGGQPAARLVLTSDAQWLRAPRVVEPGGGPVTIGLTYDAAQLSDPGVYVGTTWARPASDTLAGPSFGLTNTVVVPHTLDEPLRVSGLLTPGAVGRYFFAVPEGSGGLAVELKVRQTGQEAALHLFEPNGQPYRGGSSATAGGLEEPSATVTVSGDDLVPGVYEAVVVAPPLEAVSYELTAALPAVSVASVGTGPSAVFRATGAGAATARVKAELVGATTSAQVGGSSAEPLLMETRAPAWATQMLVDVSVPLDLWHQLTDFGVTVFDPEGRLVVDGPLSYAFGRITADLDSTLAGSPLRLELYPAFALGDPGADWSVAVRITYLGMEPRLLPVLGDSTAQSITLTPDRSVGLQFEPIPPDVELPEGASPLVAVTAEVGAGPAALRRGAAGR